MNTVREVDHRREVEREEDTTILLRPFSFVVAMPDIISSSGEG